MFNKLTDSQKAIAEQVKKYLANSYDFNILEFRCNESGYVTRTINDSELLAIYEQCNQDLVKLAERLEYLHSFSHISFAWIYKEDDTLDKLRYSDPLGFFRYASRQLIDVNSYYCQYRKRSNGMLTTEGRWFLNSDFAVFCELTDKLVEENKIDFDKLNDINEKLLLLLGIGATNKIEAKLNSELSFDWLGSQLEFGKLLTILDKYLNAIINDYKIKHGIAFSQELSYQDVQRLSRQARQQALAESKAKQEWIAKLQATKASYHQKVKTSRSGYKVTQVTSLMENLISELSLANNDKQDYLNRLVKQQANNLADGKSVAKLQQLARQATSQATNQPTVKTVKLNFKLAMPTTVANKED